MLQILTFVTEFNTGSQNCKCLDHSVQQQLHVTIYMRIEEVGVRLWFSKKLCFFF